MQAVFRESKEEIPSSFPFQAGKIDIKERRKFNLPIVPFAVVH
jgi:hypothetical protein